MNDYLDKLKTIHRCNCGRPWCEYFSGAIGEEGTSLNKDEIKGFIDELNELTPEKIANTRLYLTNLLSDKDHE